MISLTSVEGCVLDVVLCCVLDVTLPLARVGKDNPAGGRACGLHFDSGKAE